MSPRSDATVRIQNVAMAGIISRTEPAILWPNPRLDRERDEVAGRSKKRGKLPVISRCTPSKRSKDAVARPPTITSTIAHYHQRCTHAESVTETETPATPAVGP